MRIVIIKKLRRNNYDLIKSILYKIIAEINKY